LLRAEGERKLQENFVPVPKILKKFKDAEKENRTLYVCAASGAGKTTAADYYYKNKEHICISCANGTFPETALTGLHDGSVIVIDDFSFLESDAGIRKIEEILKRKKIHKVFLSRGSVPAWMKTDAIREHFMYADVWDLLLDEAGIAVYLEKFGLDPRKFPIRQIKEDTYGFLPELSSLTSYLEMGREYGPDTVSQVHKDVSQYLKNTALNYWDPKVRDFAYKMSMFESFDMEMAKAVTGESDSICILEKLLEETDTVLSGGDGTYSFRPRMREYLQYLRDTEYTENQRKDIYNRAGNYYEKKGSMVKALSAFELAGNQEMIYEVLMRNAKKHVGIAQLYDLKSWYLMLPADIIQNSPVLMAGLSMLYSLLLQPEKSEEWYKKLKNRIKNKKLSESTRKEIKQWIAYLDIALPHRGIGNLMSLLKSAAELIGKKEMKLPEMSVTGNMPSVMNGGKDFCEWSKKDSFIATAIGKPVSLAVGKFGAGLVDIALAESGIEKGTMSEYDAVSLLNRGYVKAQTNGKTEMCFVADALMARINISGNKLSMAETLMESFEKKIIHEKEDQLLPNCDAFCLLFSLLRGKNAEISAWLSQAPDENVEFRLTDRYRYLIKVRALIAEDRLEEAGALLERLNYYFTNYERNYNRMETGILKSIVLYRMKKNEWKETFKKTLLDAQSYHFIPIVSREGTAVYPLLTEMKPAGGNLDPEYFDALLKDTRRIAGYYPNYLKSPETDNIHLTEIEKTILTMLAEGVSTKQICSFMNIAYSTLKFHDKNLYRKLHAKRRAEAVAKARQLGLCK